MRTLIITDFSCIKSAEIAIDRLTILIGPQASGKSVISKLLYFFQDIILDELQFIDDGRSLRSFKEHLKEKFLEWFPVDALGDEKFIVEFINNEFSYKISRSVYKKEISDTIRIWISKSACENYEHGLARLKAVEERTNDASVESDADEADEFEIKMELRSELRKEWHSILGPDFISSQLFIPAGRSFFINLGKTLLAFDQAGMLDPITKIFGRRYTSVKERLLRSNKMQQRKFQGQEAVHRKAQIRSLLGGDLREEKEKEYLLTEDGRRVPISNISSGQQELLPLLIMVDNIMLSRSLSTRMVYIEEPEAHLFPSAQSKIVELLAIMTQKNASARNDLFITTHSPYVLAKINNLLKAGELGRNSENDAKISKIISRRAWLNSKQLSAYAILDGHVTSILDDGLISGDYLDDVSGEIAMEFSSLLEIEMENM